MAAAVWGKSQWSVLTDRKLGVRAECVTGLGFFWEESLDKDSLEVSGPFCFTAVWLEGQRASSDYRANSGKASTANCFNCQVSWKDCMVICILQ